MEVFYVVRWPATPGYPRYSFTTAPRAGELPVERLQACTSIREAAAISERLNAEDRAAGC